MKTGIPSLLAAAALVAAAALAVQNHSLRTRLARAEAGAAPRPARSAPEPAAGPAPRSEGAPSNVAARAVARTDPAPPRTAGPEGTDREAFDQAVEERVRARVAEIERERRDEHEARRREWENATEEEREEHRRKFRERMQEHATAQISEFETKTGMDVEQCSAFECELEAFDVSIREIAERYAVMIDGGVPFGAEMQTRVLNEMSAAALDAYDGLRESLPEDIRKKGGEFNLMFGISPTSLSPLFDALRRSGAFGAHGPGPFGPFGGRHQRP